MSRKSIVSMGLASALIIPTLGPAVNAQLVHSKSNLIPTETNQPEIQMVSNKISKKAKVVINKIKAINPKKSNYVSKTLAAQNAYKKLSKKDKRLVKNYSTLKKHVKKIQPMLKQVAALKKSVASINNKNYKTKTPSVQKAFQKMSVQTVAAVPASTKATLTNYVNLSVATTSLTKLKTLSASNSATSTDGPAIMDFITAYKKLKPDQKAIIDGYFGTDIINDYLNLEEVAQGATDVEKKYTKLNKKKKTYVKDAVAVYRAYLAASDDEKDYMPHADAFEDIRIKYSNEIEDADKFTELVNELSQDSDRNSIDYVNDFYNNISKKNDYEYIAPIELVDKTTLKTFNAYTKIPEIIDLLNDKLPAYNTQFTNEDATNANTMYTLYKKLGASQKAIVQDAADNPEYLNQEVNFKAAQAVDKKYNAAVKKAAIPDYLKVVSDFNKLSEEAKTFVVNSDDIVNIKKRFDKQIKDAENFADEVEKLSEYNKTTNPTFTKALDTANTNYKKLSETTPGELAALPLVDKSVIKSYENFKLVPNLLNSIAILYPTANKLVSPITENKINKMLDAIKVYNKLDKPQKKVVDAIYPSFPDLVSDEKNIKKAQSIDKQYASLKKSSKTYPKDAEKVYNAYNDSGADVQTYVVHTEIKDLLKGPEYTTAQGLADAFKKKVNGLSYKSPVSYVEEAENLYNETVAPNPHVISILDSNTLGKYKEYLAALTTISYLDLVLGTTDRDIKNIRKAISTYNKLTENARYIVDHADNANLGLIADEANLNAAQKIDDAYNAVKLNSPTYESELIEVYKQLLRAPKVVQKYVVNSSILNAQYDKYEPKIFVAMDFEDNVNDLMYTSPISSVQNVVDKYNDYIKPDPVVEMLVNKDVMKDYRNYENILKIQEISSYLYGYGTSIQNASKTHYEIGYIPDIIDIMNAYDGLSTKQKAIVNTAITKSSQPSKYSEYDIIWPMDFLKDDKNIKKAIEIDKKYNAIKDQNNIKDLYAIWIEYNLPRNADAIKYVINYKEIEAIGNSEKLIPLSTFINLVKALNTDSTLDDVDQVVTLYEKMDADIQSLIDKSVLTKFNKYAPISKIREILTDPPINDYTTDDITEMLNAITIYSKLSGDAKKVITNSYEIPEIPEFLTDEKEIKAAQKVDKQYEALDDTKSTYQKDAILVYQEYEKLSEKAKDYIVNKQGLGDIYNQYMNPQLDAKDFEEMVNSLGLESEYADVVDVVDAYNMMDDDAKALVDTKVMDNYNKYANVVTIANLLEKVSTPPIDHYKPSEIEYVSQAINLYNKLDKVQKVIMDNSEDDIDNLDLLLDEASLIAAQALDVKIEKIKPGASNFDRGVVEAGKIYELLSDTGKAYVQNSKRLQKYRDQSSDGSVDEAIEKLVQFELGIREVAKLDSDQEDGYEEEIIDKMFDLVALNKKLNREVTKVNNTTIKLISLVDRKALSDYQYYYALYDVKEKLNSLEGQ